MIVELYNRLYVTVSINKYIYVYYYITWTHYIKVVLIDTWLQMILSSEGEQNLFSK